MENIPTYFNNWRTRFKKQPSTPMTESKSTFDLGSTIGQSYANIQSVIKYPSVAVMESTKTQIFSSFLNSLDDTTKDLLFDVLRQKQETFLQNSIYNVKTLDSRYIADETSDKIDKLVNINEKLVNDIETLSQEVESERQSVVNTFDNIINTRNL